MKGFFGGSSVGAESGVGGEGIGFFQCHQGGSDDAGFVAELGRQELEILVMNDKELFLEALTEWLEEEFACFCHATADDEGIRYEGVGHVHNQAPEHPGVVVPESECDGIALLRVLGEAGGGAVVEFLFTSGGFVAEASFQGEFVIADIVFDSAEIAEVTFSALPVDAGLSEFSCGAAFAADELIVDDDTTADTCAESETDQAVHASSGSELPFGVRHAVGVIIEGDGEIEGFFHDFLDGNFMIPDRDVCELVEHTFVVVAPAGHAEADRLYIGVFFDQLAGGLDHRLDYLSRAVVFLRGKRRFCRQDGFALNNTHFDGGGAKIYADSQRGFHVLMMWLRGDLSEKGRKKSVFEE